MTLRLLIDVRRTMAAAVIVACSIALAGCSSGSPSATGGGSGSRLCPVTTTAHPLRPGETSTTLPPSHDNDAGRMRIPDAYPDADVDANQRPDHGKVNAQGSSERRQLPSHLTLARSGRRRGGGRRGAA